MAGDEAALPIREVVDETGVARELVHHYLRAGLLPPPVARGRYSARHVELLKQIRALRERHHLPLELIRATFETFDHDPEAVASLALADSLGARLARLARGEELVGAATLGRSALLAETGVDATHLEACEAAGLLRASPDGRFTHHDRDLLALTARGTALGIPLDSFRTVVSYTRVAFTLERDEFLGVDRDLPSERLLPELFLRRELASSLVQTALSAAIETHLGARGAELRREGRPGLDDVVYRPSAAFVRRHGLDRMLDQARERLGEKPGDPRTWEGVARLMLHAGRYREAGFVLARAAERWPSDRPLLHARARAGLLLGEKPAAPTAVSGPDRALLAVARLADRATAARSDEARALAEAALAAEAPAHARLEARMLAGYALAALPPAIGTAARGLELLTEAFEATKGPLPPPPLPGMDERLRLNAAWLLFETLGRHPDPTRPTRDALRDVVCVTDPGCALAEAAFLQGEPNTHPNGGRRG